MIDAPLLRPTGNGPWPGIVVIHDIFGRHGDVHEQARWLAAEGFITVVPNLFGERRPIACLVHLFRDLAQRSGITFELIERSRRQLTADPECNGQVGVIGFCLGGDFALLLAGDGAYSVASVNYGGVPDDAGDLLAGACPVVGSYGARDRRLVKARSTERLTAALESNGIAHDVKEYPLAGHAFLNHAGPIVTRVGQVFGIGYQAEAAEDARQRILRFFRRHLSDTQPI